MAPVLLSTELLDLFLERATAADVSHVKQLQPGLSDARIDEILANSLTEIEMPPEGRILWTWRNGIPAFAPWWVARGTRLLSLEESVACYFRSRADGFELKAGLEPELDVERDFWPKRFLPFLDQEEALVAMDTTHTGGAPSPVHQLPLHDHREDAIAKPDLPSVGTLLQWWIEAIDERLWCWDTTNNRWDYSNHEAVPYERRFYI